MVIVTKPIGNVPRTVKIWTNTQYKGTAKQNRGLQFKSFEEHSLDKKNLHFFSRENSNTINVSN